jgi:hypothetical protein
MSLYEDKAMAYVQCKGTGWIGGMILANLQSRRSMEG